MILQKCHRRKVPSWLLLLAACGLMPWSGCGKSDSRLALSGTVAVDGRPLESGYIQFRPIEPANHPATGANIVAGRFDIVDRRGALPGTFRVEITASRKTTRKVPDASGAMIEAFEQYIPAQYNQQSKLTAEVKAGGPNQFDFQLVLK